MRSSMTPPSGVHSIEYWARPGTRGAGGGGGRPAARGGGGPVGGGGEPVGESRSSPLDQVPLGGEELELGERLEVDPRDRIELPVVLAQVTAERLHGVG